MLSKKENVQSELILYTMEQLVPEDSLYRKIDKYIDFFFIYDEVKDLYCEDNGRHKCSRNSKQWRKDTTELFHKYK